MTLRPPRAVKVGWRAGTPSVRGRILLWYAALAAAALTISVVLTHQLLVAYLGQRADSELSSEVSELQSMARSGVDPQTGHPFRTVGGLLGAALARGVQDPDAGAVTIVGDSITGVRGPQWIRGAATTSVVGRWSAIRAPTFGTVSTSQGPARFLAVPVKLSGSSGQGVYVVASLTARDAALARTVTRIGAEAGAAALLAALLIAWIVAGRLMRPVRYMTDLARSISETDLSRRIPVVGSDELSALASTFNGMLDRLEEAFAAQQLFVQDASHELRTPITIIRGQLEVAGGDPDDLAETMTLVFDELDRMDRLVRDLLTLTRLAQPSPLQLKPVSVATMAEEVFSKATSLGRRAWQLDADLGDTEALLDRQLLTQAVLQLAANAVQHTELDDKIVIKAEIADGHVRFSVRDWGPGIPDYMQARIFDRFARLAHGNGRTEGAGLGLAIVRAIAEAHGGTATVQSTPGVGATFCVSVPFVTQRVRSALPAGTPR